MEKQEGNGAPKTDLPKEIDIHYIKTPSYRTYHADGMFGGGTPNGKIYFEFFVQRPVTPKVIRQKITPEGQLGDEISREGKTGVVREIEAGVIMDVAVAIEFKDWLDKYIKAVKEAEEKMKEYAASLHGKTD